MLGSLLDLEEPTVFHTGWSMILAECLGAQETFQMASAQLLPCSTRLATENHPSHNSSCRGALSLPTKGGARRE